MIGSLFYDLPKTSEGAFPRGGMIWILLLNNALIAMAELTSTFGGRSIILKHKTFAFYRPTAFVVAQFIIDVPTILAQVLLSDMIVSQPVQYDVSTMFLKGLCAGLLYVQSTENGVTVLCKCALPLDRYCKSYELFSKSLL